MATKFLRRAQDWNIVDSSALNVHDVLPGGNYIIRQDPVSGTLYLQSVEEFHAPPKFYGDTLQRAERILTTFESRPAGTGVLLSGEKGSGKTLLARTVSIMGAERGIPTIIINAPWAGDAFFSFLNAITQPCIIMFDEFEKVYSGSKDDNAPKITGQFYGDNQAQNAILTLLDGVFQTKKLFLLTCNDKYGINRNMLNRPGRIFYAIEFNGLGEEFVRQYAQDNLKNKDRVEQIVRVASMFTDFNFDMLKALIEEMNRYGESAADALSLLNISPERDYSQWNVSILPAGKDVAATPHLHPTQIDSPHSQKNGIKIRVYVNTGKMVAADEDEYDDDGIRVVRANGKLVPETEAYWATFNQGDIIQMSSERMVYRNKDGDILNLTRVRYAQSNWRSFAEDMPNGEFHGQDF